MAERAGHRRLPNGGEEAEEAPNRLADLRIWGSLWGTVPSVAQPESRMALGSCSRRQLGAPPPIADEARAPPESGSGVASVDYIFGCLEPPGRHADPPRLRIVIWDLR